MRILVLILLIGSFHTVYTQNELDLYRYSKHKIYGDARFEAMGGAFGALGANLASSQINPAGFGRYSRNQFVGSFGLESRKQKSIFQEEELAGSNFLAHINNAGVILVNDESKLNKGWVFSQLGLGFNRLKGFRNSFKYTGSTDNSMLNSIANQSAGFSPDQLYLNFPFSSSMAWETYAINYDDSTRTYYPVLSGPNQHTRTISEKGGINEFFISASGNYLNRLYLGANFGVRFVNFEQGIEHQEKAISPTNSSIQSFVINNSLRVSGTGTNVKVGVLFLPIDRLRLGFSIHTPTFYELEDDYTADMTTVYKDTTIKLPDAFKPEGNYKYRLRTPAKFVGSFGYIFGTKACVSADLEYIPYRTSHFRSTTDENYVPYDYIQENKIAKEAFAAGMNLRLGGEYVINGVLFIRGGFGAQSKAYAKSTNIEPDWDLTFSGGLGLKFEKITVDMAFSKEQWNRNYTPFEGNTSNFKTTSNRFIISCAYFIQ
ncbi:MAG: outer membrane protein transport protein [Bacteroidetes bacterium]|nr:outer membrane protein transport protein [Bacteroidota bacterium]